jgi:hypothetical protein
MAPPLASRWRANSPDTSEEGLRRPERGSVERTAGEEAIEMTPVRLWIGLVLVTLGVFGVLDATGTLESTDAIERWWPIAIIGAGLLVMADHRRISVGPTIVVVLGSVLLANQQGWTTEDLLGPALLVLIGLAVLAGATRGRRTKGGEISAGSPLAIFGGSTIKDRSAHLTHAEATALFGGATLDLREAHIDDEATVDATAIFGAVDVLVPRGWRVSLGGLPIFGGYDDKTGENGALPDNAPRLNVRATAIFGGVDVAHESR